MLIWEPSSAAAVTCSADGYTPSYAVLVETEGKERQQRWILFAGLTGAMRTVADERSVEEILSASAPPGYSEHHTGRAIDIDTDGAPPLEIEFEGTPAFAWLTTHAGRFGFVGSTRAAVASKSACAFLSSRSPIASSVAAGVSINSSAQYRASTAAVPIAL